MAEYKRFSIKTENETALAIADEVPGCWFLFHRYVNALHGSVQRVVHPSAYASMSIILKI